jgi:hypothetical protein
MNSAEQSKMFAALELFAAESHNQQPQTLNHCRKHAEQTAATLAYLLVAGYW